MVAESLGGAHAATRHPGPRDELAMWGPSRLSRPQKAQTPPPPALFSCTARRSQRGLCRKGSGRQPVWGGQSPGSQATGSGGRPGNSLCCDASQSQGLVSQPHRKVASGLDTPGSGAMTDHRPAFAARRRAAGRRGELGPAGIRVQKPVHCPSQTALSQPANQACARWGRGPRVPREMLSQRWPRTAGTGPSK